MILWTRILLIHILGLHLKVSFVIFMKIGFVNTLGVIQMSQIGQIEIIHYSLYIEDCPIVRLSFNYCWLNYYTMMRNRQCLISINLPVIFMFCRPTTYLITWNATQTNLHEVGKIPNVPGCQYHGHLISENKNECPQFLFRLGF